MAKFLASVLSAVTLGAALLVSGGASAADAEMKITKAPEGMLSIHYYRPDGAYAAGEFAKCDFTSCWGVHAWGDAYDSDTSWFKPVFPVGKDDFGAVYQFKANEDKEISAGVDANYIIHKGDAKDQCAKDMAFSPDKGKEIFVVSNDCNVYYTLADALKAKASAK